MSDTNNLSYAGVAIRERGEMLNLTDMWKAMECNPSQRPVEWLRLPDTCRFVEALVEKVGNSHLFQIGRGRNGATYAHWQIGLAYAKYLSPEFHMWCNEVVRAHMERKALEPPAPKASPAVVVGLSQGARQAVGGIVKAVVGKALDDRLLTGAAPLKPRTPSDAEARMRALMAAWGEFSPDSDIALMLQAEIGRATREFMKAAPSLRGLVRKLCFLREVLSEHDLTPFEATIMDICVRDATHLARLP